MNKSQQKGTVAAWMDFLVGFPVDTVELQAIVGEVSSLPDLEAKLVEEVPGGGRLTPAFPKTFFGGYKDEKIMLNLTAIESDYSEFMAPDLHGVPKPKNLHWFLRCNIMSVVNGNPRTWPYVSEFMALAVRLMLDRFWVKQESNPFLFSGNFFDSKFLTSGFIKEIIEPTDDQPWPSYRITWRKNPDDPNSNGEFIVFPTDFVDYQVGDRVLIIKDITNPKISQLWSDDDMKVLGGTNNDPSKPIPNCSVAPIMLYYIDPDKTS